MKNSEARAVLAAQLKVRRELSYGDLAKRIGEVENFEVTAASGVKYQIEIQYFWDAQPRGDIRVLGSVDDSGWRAFVPLCEDFIRSSKDGSCA